MTVGERIKEARKLAGLTQGQLAKMCNLATVTIRQYEANTRTPNNEQLNLIADATKTSLIFFFPQSKMFESAAEAHQSRVEAEQLALLEGSVRDFLAFIYGERHEVKVQGTYMEGHLIVYGYGDGAVAISDEDEDLMADAIRVLLLSLANYRCSPAKHAEECLRKDLSGEEAKAAAQFLAQGQDDCAPAEDLGNPGKPDAASDGQQ